MKHGLVSHARVVVVWKALRGIYGNNEDYEFAFEMIFLYSLVMLRQWGPGKNNTLMVVTEYEHGWRNPLSIYGLLNLVYDSGKIWFKSIWVLLMLVYDRGKFWSSSIWVQLMSGLSVFNGLILIHFSSKLKGLLAARRVIETILLALIGPVMIKAQIGEEVVAGRLVRLWTGNTREREYKRCIGGKEGFTQYHSIRNLMV